MAGFRVQFSAAQLPGLSWLPITMACIPLTQLQEEKSKINLHIYV